jgi:hypothetical protein
MDSRRIRSAHERNFGDRADRGRERRPEDGSRYPASHGHAGLTMNIYTHAQDPAKRAALEKFESRLVN